MSVFDTYLWAVSLYANWRTAVSLVLVLIVGPVLVLVVEWAVAVLIGGRRGRSAS